MAESRKDDLQFLFLEKNVNERITSMTEVRGRLAAVSLPCVNNHNSTEENRMFG